MKIDYLPYDKIEEYLQSFLPHLTNQSRDPDNLRLTLRMFFRLPHIATEDDAANEVMTLEGRVLPDLDSMMRLQQGLRRLRETTYPSQQAFFIQLFRDSWRTSLDFEHGLLSTPWGLVRF